MKGEDPQSKKGWEYEENEEFIVERREKAKGIGEKDTFTNLINVDFMKRCLFNLHGLVMNRAKNL